MSKAGDGVPGPGVRSSISDLGLFSFKEASPLPSKTDGLLSSLALKHELFYFRVGGRGGGGVGWR